MILGLWYFLFPCILESYVLYYFSDQQCTEICHESFSGIITENFFHIICYF